MVITLTIPQKVLVVGGPCWKPSRFFIVNNICRKRNKSSGTIGIGGPRLATERAQGRASSSIISPNIALPTQPCRTRFAPSPTGDLHLGSLRTALFNYLLAKSTGGQFLLRIEDTDRKRTVVGAEQRLFRDLKWAGLEWDEGPEIGGPYGPYKQSERTALYQEHAQKLVKSGHAYRCFCTPLRLLELAKQRHELALSEGYDRTCTHVSSEESESRAKGGESHVIRLKALSSVPVWTDLIYGVRKEKRGGSNALINPGFDDAILVKSDGTPTYHLANVVDDHYMKITHVVRGAEWMSSTPKHITMYQAFGWEPPAFAHVGLLVDEHHQKLSKRNLDTDIASYRKQSILPETLNNFVALLGWSHNSKSDVKSLQQLVDQFSMKFTKGDTMVSLEKLWFLQKAHAASRVHSDDPAQLYALVSPIVYRVHQEYGGRQLGIIQNRRSIEHYVADLLKVTVGSYTNASEYVEKFKFFFSVPNENDLLSSQHRLVSFDTLNPTIQDPDLQKKTVLDILSLQEVFSFPKTWDERTRDPIAECQLDYIKSKVQEVLEGTDHSKSDGMATNKLSSKMLSNQWAALVHSYFRWALSAGRDGPGSADVIRLLGRTESLRRFALARELVESGQVRFSAKL